MPSIWLLTARTLKLTSVIEDVNANWLSHSILPISFLCLTLASSVCLCVTGMKIVPFTQVNRRGSHIHNGITTDCMSEWWLVNRGDPLDTLIMIMSESESE